MEYKCLKAWESYSIGKEWVSGEFMRCARSAYFAGYVNGQLDAYGADPEAILALANVKINSHKSTE
jgi:hypothetical protein